MSTNTVQKRPGGRSAAVLNSVKIAVEELVQEKGRDPNRPIPELGSLKADLTQWASEIVEHYRNPTNAALLRGGAASAGEFEVDCTRNRRAEAGMMVERYGDRSPITPDDVLDHLVAPIIYRTIFLPWTLDDSTADSLVDGLFAGR
jgi:hypothetical protein